LAKSAVTCPWRNIGDGKASPELDPQCAAMAAAMKGA